MSEIRHALTWRHGVMLLVWAAGLGLLVGLSRAHPPHHEAYEGIVVGVMMTDGAIVVFCDCRAAILEAVARIKRGR